MSQNNKKTLMLSQRQADLLLGFEYGKSYSINEIGDFSVEKASLATLKRDISNIKNLGYIDVIGEKRGARYLLSDYGLVHRPIDAKSYFTKSELDRNGATSFNFELFTILKNKNIFTSDEFEKLELATKIFHAKAQDSSPVIHAKELERFIIELSWKSSKIEGNTYTLLDTEKLIREGISAEGKTKNETTMILNHKKAFDYILELRENQKKITITGIENIHKLLITDLGVSHGIRKGSVGITGSSYIPLGIQLQIKEYLEQLVDVINSQENGYAKGLLAVMGISYLQPFEDGNKRTARLLANTLLLFSNLAPLSYRNVDEIEYREAMLVFYEQNSIESFKKIFVNQYIFACENYNIAEVV